MRSMFYFGGGPTQPGTLVKISVSIHVRSKYGEVISVVAENWIGYRVNVTDAYACMALLLFERVGFVFWQRDVGDLDW